MLSCIFQKMCRLIPRKIRGGNIHKRLNNSIRQNMLECQVNGVHYVSQTKASETLTSTISLRNFEFYLVIPVLEFTFMFTNAFLLGEGQLTAQLTI